ncbi:MAG: ABC transporter permease [Candidatus Acidiferrales bacterium]
MFRETFRKIFRRKRNSTDFSAEIEAHIELEIERLREQGLSDEDAHNAAYRAFGNVTKAQERFYESGRWLWFDHLWQDVRFALRMLRKSPGFTAVAVLTLALGIGANTAIFSLVNGVLLSALPVPDAQRLVVLHWMAKKSPKHLDSSGFGDCDVKRQGEGAASCSISYPMFQALQSRANVFSSVAAFAGPVQLALSGNGAPSTVQAMLATGDYFSTLEVRATLGRTLVPSDDTVGAAPVVVLACGYWKSAFGGSPSVIGRSIFLNNIAFTIVGVADPTFTSLTPGKSQDMWIPAMMDMDPRVTPADWKIELNDDHSVWLLAVARLKAGVSIAQAEAAANVIFRNEVLHGAKPLFTEDADPRMIVTQAWSALSFVRNRIAEPIYVLGLAVGMILLIACANVAGLTLARAAGREKEMAVRRALGARRGRIVRQLLTESILLSAVGGALGIAFAWWGRDVLVSLLQDSSRPLGFSFAIDGRVLAFTAAASIFTGIIFGLAPALRSARVDLTPVLKEGAGSSSGVARPGGRWLTAGNGLVVVQIALSIVVLAGAGLLVRTLENLRSVNPGFDPQNILLFGIDPTLLGYSPTQIENLYNDLQGQLAAVPGVTSVSYSGDSLLSDGWWSTGVHIEGRPANEDAGTYMLAVSPEFFSTMHIPLRSGRGFTHADMVQAVSAEQTVKGASPAANQVPLAMMVNEAFARKYFLNQNPVGKQATRSGRTLQIIGVFGNTKYGDLRTPVGPLAFIPAVNSGVQFEVRTAIDPEALVITVRKLAARVDSAVPLFDIRTQTEQIDRLLAQERLVARLSGFFGVLALVLACIGLYGLLSYEVARRTRELGIRMALGAQQRDLLRLVVGQGILLVLIGAAIGIAAAIGVTRFMATMLYGVHPNDPATIIGVAILLTLVALAACYIPAHRAMRVDPMVALRHE